MTTKDEIDARLEEIGIIPAVRLASSEHARYAAEALSRAGIPIAEITMTVPRAIEVISELAKSLPEMIIGAGTVLDVETAERCMEAGAKFLTSTGFVPEVVGFARKKGLLVIPGALTPSEVIHAWKAGADFVKIFPCGPLGGDAYIRALKAPFPQVRFVAAGGVNLQTALNYILAGASALGVGGELIPKDALLQKQEERVRELARRFLAKVKEGRSRLAATQWAAPIEKIANEGLCADCLHARSVKSDRGSTFLLCDLSARDPSFPKYPRLPVLSCPGYQKKKM